MAAEPRDCILCRRSCPDSRQGLHVRGHYICLDCEAKIISVSREDPAYEIYMEGLKKIWSQAV